MITKFLSLPTAFLLACSVFACGGESDGGSTTSSSADAGSDPATVDAGAQPGEEGWCDEPRYWRAWQSEDDSCKADIDRTDADYLALKERLREESSCTEDADCPMVELRFSCEGFGTYTASSPVQPAQEAELEAMYQTWRAALCGDREAACVRPEPCPQEMPSPFVTGIGACEEGHCVVPASL